MTHIIKKFILRIVATKRIWVGSQKHFFLISMDKKNLIELVKDEDFEVNLLTHGMRDYNVVKVVKKIADNYDNEDMILMKAEYEANALNDK